MSKEEIHTIQAERDLGANWEVNLAQKLEDYLLKICSGQISSANDAVSVNFAEAALLLQGSIQVYSRKVEYLYNLVLHTLNFLSQKRQDEQLEGTSEQPEQYGTSATSDRESDQFWVSEDIPVEARNSLDASTSKSDTFYNFVKPPANLVVLEGDCLDTTGDGGELESYLLATTDLYKDFILLDPCDAVSVNNFLNGNGARKGQSSAYKGSSTHKSFRSPSRRSGGTARKSSRGKNQEENLIEPAVADCSLEENGFNMMPDPPAFGGFDMDDDNIEPTNLEGSDDDNEDDPWKPLNPHEPGNLKVKPFIKEKPHRKNAANSTKQNSITTLFPLAKMHGTISPELTQIWEERCKKSKRNENPESPPLYEKLRQSLSIGIYDTSDTFANDGNEKDGGVPDFGGPDDEMPESMYMDEDLPPHDEQYDDGPSHFDADDGHEDPSSQKSLEDLCRSHLDALLANIAETENQTELAARVSSWKQKIEYNLEEQDSRPSFDIHAYGERIIEKLSLESDNDNVMSFADVVKGQEKHDVARTFSALLQLVNNGDVHLEKGGGNGQSICYTAVNPFHIKLLNRDNKWNDMQFRLSKKRLRTPLRKGCNGSADKFGKENCNIPMKLGKLGSAKCTPEGKKRRKAQFSHTVDIHSSQ